MSFSIDPLVINMALVCLSVRGGPIIYNLCYLTINPIMIYMGLIYPCATGDSNVYDLN